MSSEVETSLTVYRRLDNNNERFLDSARNDRVFQQSRMASTSHLINKSEACHPERSEGPHKQRPV